MRIKRPSQFWRADWHLSLLLGLLLVIVFVLYPISDRGPLMSVVLQVFFSLLLLSGVPLVARRRVVGILAIVLAVVAAAIGWIRLALTDERLTALGVMMWMLVLAMLAWMLLIRVFSEGRINLHRIQGAVAVYLLLGVIWAGGYRLSMQVTPTAFSLREVGDEAALMSRLVYFSFVTLTTVGYGDITAVHPAARSLALLEGLTGQLFPAVLIARLVSMEVIHRQKN